MTYIAIIVGVLILLNFYSVYVSQNFIFRSKRDTMMDKASLLSATLTGVEELNKETVSKVVDVLKFDSQQSVRVIVTDETVRAVYDNSIGDNVEGKLILLNEIRSASEGNDVFYTYYDGTAVISRTAVPVMLGGQMIGAVYLYEADDEQGALLKDIQRNLLNISLVICAGVILLSTLLSQFFTRRIGALLKAIRKVRDGDYSHRAVVKGHDELSDLAAEFNGLSERLEKVEDMRRTFVSDASHELKTPLASVKILVDSIVQNTDMPPDTIREFLEGISEETDRLTRLTERLLNVSRLDAKVSRQEPVELSEVVIRAAHILEPIAAGRNVTVSLSLEEDRYIFANGDDIYQIVFNLAENAIKYNKVGGEVNIYLFAKSKKVFFIVQDTGIGIPEEDINRVFERFYRVDKARSRETGGSGLGLAIVSAAAKQYGGEIKVESQLGAGTRISVSFPQCNSKGMML